MACSVRGLQSRHGNHNRRNRLVATSARRSARWPARDRRPHASTGLVHRMMTFGWSPRVERAVAANAGSYTLPTFDESFPFGLAGTDVSESAQRAVFSRPLLILLGERDVDPKDKHLPREPGARRQGPHRFARGHRYFETARSEAAHLGVPFKWQLVTVPGVAHSGEQMSPHAARHLFEETPPK